MPNREQILITGSSSGIGRQVAIDLSERYDLVLSGRNAEKLVETLALCGSGDHQIWAYDLAETENLQKDFEEWHATHNLHVSGFVHCAGVVMVTASRMITQKHIAQIFNVNFNSAMLITASLLKRRMSVDSLQKLVFISALFSRFGNPAHTIYAASKGALDSAMRSLSIELAPKIRVNTVCPGGVDTPMANDALNNPAIKSRLLEQYPLGIGEPKDISNMIEFLLSDKARWITGQQIFVDGGRSVNMALNNFNKG